MKTLIIVAVIVAVIIIAAVIALRIVNKKAKEKKEENIKLAENAGNLVTTNIFIIDKAMKKPEEANLPQKVVEALPKAVRKVKLPIVKAKVGPKIMTLVCEKDVYEQILPKQEVKAKMAGAVIVSAHRLRGPVAGK